MGERVSSELRCRLPPAERSPPCAKAEGWSGPRLGDERLWRKAKWRWRPRNSVHHSGMSDFKKLRVWRKAHSLALNVHRVASSIRGAQNVSMRSQMVRAAMSIPANIVEGREQQSEREFARFIGYSLGSSSELENHLIAARDVKAISSNEYKSTIDQLIDVRKMLHGLRRSLSKTTPSTPEQPVLTPAAKSAKRSAGGRRQRT